MEGFKTRPERYCQPLRGGEKKERKENNKQVRPCWRTKGDPLKTSEKDNSDAAAELGPD